MNNRLGRDLISDLPLGIIEIILMFLTIRDAIRTSILSTKWRYRWTSLPQLVFEENYMVSSGPNPLQVHDGTHEKCLKNFVTSTLFLHEGPIHKFKLHVENVMSRCPVTDQWLRFLYRKDIKELTLGIELNGYNKHFNVHSCLYSFKNLTFLELYGCEFGPPTPNFKGFLCLRTLILQYVEVPSGTIESLVSNSPLLENLECTCVGWSKLRITAPNLKYFCIGGTYEEIYLCAPLLAKMNITMGVQEGLIDLQLREKHTDCNYTKFLGDCTNLESLTGNGCFTKYLSMGIEYFHHHPLAFHCLKIITLNEVNFQCMNEVLVVVCLVMDAANLCELQVRCDFYEYDDDAEDHIHFWDSKCPQNCSFKKLKTIKMTDFCGELLEMKFIKFLLESSPVLETMIVKPPLFHTTHLEILDTAVELLSYSWASTNAKISFKKKSNALSQ